MKGDFHVRFCERLAGEIPACLLDHESFRSGLYSKSYSYYWLAGKDTLNLRLNVTEYKEDTTFLLRIYHRKPILFTAVLEKITECFPLIAEDFNPSKLTSLHFKEPVFYLDLAQTLSNEYEQEFGRKNISHEKLNQFLLQSSLTSQLNHFLNPLHKKVKDYGLEKFHIIDKEIYKEYLPNVDLTEYPEFTFNAHTGIVVKLEKTDDL
jgi:hypothetical protein